MIFLTKCKSIVKQILLITLFLSLLFSSAAQTKVINSWRDPQTTINNPGIHTIVVAALINDQLVRKQVEDYMVSLYPGKATQSHKLFGNDSLLHKDESYYNDLLKKKGYDGIVLMQQTGESTQERFVRGQPPTLVNNWGGYWRRGWGRNFIPRTGSQGHLQEDRNWLVQVTVFSIKANKLIWISTTKTTNPGGRLALFQDVCEAVKREMISEGLIR